MHIITLIFQCSISRLAYQRVGRQSCVTPPYIYSGKGITQIMLVFLIVYIAKGTSCSHDFSHGVSLHMVLSSYYETPVRMIFHIVHPYITFDETILNLSPLAYIPKCNPGALVIDPQHC